MSQFLKHYADSTWGSNRDKNVLLHRGITPMDLNKKGSIEQKITIILATQRSNYVLRYRALLNINTIPYFVLKHHSLKTGKVNCF